MVITYLGDGSFRLQSGSSGCLIDPKSARLKANLVLRTSTAVNDWISHPRGAGKQEGEIAFPGEYELEGWEVQGFPVAAESDSKVAKTVYLVRREEMSFVFLGQVSGVLAAQIMEKLGESDVLFMPLDHDRLLPDAALKILKQLSPYLVILNDSPGASSIIKAMGRKEEPQDKLVLKRRDLAGERGRIAVLKAAT